MRSSFKTLIAWGFYDWANSAYSSIVMTFVLPAYFIHKIASNPAEGALAWGWTVSLAGLLIALLSPLIGASADYGGGAKRWIGTLVIINVIITSLLPFTTHETTVLLLFAVGTITAECAFICYNAMLPALASPNEIGRWSGWGWGMGYLGGMSALIVAYLTAVNPFFLAALWHLLFSLPLFLFTPSTPAKVPFLESFHSLKGLLKQLNPTLIRFFIARLFFIDGLTTLFAFGGLFAAQTFGMPDNKVLLFGITLNIAAGLGALLLAYVDDYVGSKKVMVLSLICLIALGSAAIFSTTENHFWIWSFFLSLFVGPLQASSRSFLARLAPENLRNQLFGVFTLSGKATSFLGPWVLSALVFFTGNMRLGMSTILLFFLIGLIVLIPTREEIR